ncbi:MAG: hypothetical protein ABII01_00645 [Candidatus Woesearchaeota archaeon]
MRRLVAFLLVISLFLGSFFLMTGCDPTGPKTCTPSDVPWCNHVSNNPDVDDGKEKAECETYEYFVDCTNEDSNKVYDCTGKSWSECDSQPDLCNTNKKDCVWS